MLRKACLSLAVVLPASAAGEFGALQHAPTAMAAIRGYAAYGQAGRGWGMY